jgi:formylglycine-generating enzyme required for sulfatase activity
MYSGSSTPASAALNERQSRKLASPQVAIAFGCAFALGIAIALPLPPQASRLQQIQRDSIPGTLVTFETVAIPSGSVTVDAPDGPRTVAVAPFHIGRTEVTWDMYDVFFLRLDERGSTAAADAVARPSQPYGAPDYGWGHAGYPVISVARSGAMAFCEWLSAKTGKKYRLPTEAEWLRAAELAAGGMALSAQRRDTLAWNRGNANNMTHPVASRSPDALGLYDLFGNAAEWVITQDNRPVVRGGSFEDPADAIGPRARAVQDDSWNARDPQLPRSRWWLSDGPFAGFRIVREP